MARDNNSNEKGVSRRDFVKKLVYIAPVVTTLIIPKYIQAAPSCSQRCSVVCSNQCPNQCRPRCSGRLNAQETGPLSSPFSIYPRQSDHSEGQSDPKRKMGY